MLLTNCRAQLEVNTPANPVECQPLELSWSGGAPPYLLSVSPAGSPDSPPLLTFPIQTGTSLTWNVNIAAGTPVSLTLRDSDGTTSQSAIFTILSGTDTSCL